MNHLKLDEDSTGHHDCHSYVTNYCHSNGIFPTKKQLKFIQKAYQINVIRDDFWSFLDFLPYTSKDGFRKTIHRLKPIIEKVIPSIPAFYKLRGVPMRGVTKYPTGLKPRNVNLDFEKKLRNLKNQPPMMHDLHLLTLISGLHERLQKNPNFVPNNRNKAFTVRLNFDRRFPTTINVYRDKMQVMVGCSQQPLPYSIFGFLQLSSHLGQVVECLTAYANHNFIHDPIPNWIVTLYHFNRDGLIIESPVFNYTITDLANHSVLYMKHFENGTTRPRYEEHRMPHKSLEQMAQESACIFNDDYCSGDEI